jgi:Domain of unknown function (DUF4055)
MAVDSVSKDYDLMRSRWKMARDCSAGSHEVKAAGTTYLPALAGHDPRKKDDPYWDYVRRGLYYNATGRTVDGLVGMVFRKPPVVEVPAAAEKLTEDVDLMGRRLEEFAKALLRELLITGRAGVLVDHTVPPAERRPYMRMYFAEDILDIVEEVIGGAVVPTMIRVREVFEEPSDTEEFATKEIIQIRVMELVNGVYQQRVFRRLDDASFPAEADEEITPTVDGETLDFIPFWVFSVEEGGRPSVIYPPPLIDLCEVNLCHYRQEADYRNALHMAGVPTLFVSGTRNDSGEVKVGSAEVQFLEEADAKAYFVSYGAEGAAAIRQSLDDLQQMMAFLGARMLQPEKRAAEAAETAQIHRQGEISVLGSIANSINSRLTLALQFMLDWALISGDEAKLELNDDFAPTQAPPALLAEMMKAWQSGAISHDSLWAFMQAGELVDPRRTAEEERALVEEEQPEPEAETQEIDLEGKRIGLEQQRLALEQQAGGQPEQVAAE